MLLATALWAGASPLVALAHNGVDHGKGAHVGAKHKAMNHGQAKKQAGETHAHKAPHGGLMKSVGTHHVELFVSPTSLTVWVLGDKMVPEPAIKAGRVVLQVPGKPAQTLTLAPMQNHLMTMVTLKDVKSFVAIVSVPVEGKTQSTRFVYTR